MSLYLFLKKKKKNHKDYISHSVTVQIITHLLQLKMEIHFFLD